MSGPWMSVCEELGAVRICFAAKRILHRLDSLSNRKQVVACEDLAEYSSDGIPFSR